VSAAADVPVLEGFDPMSDAYRLDSARAVQGAIESCPVGYYEPLNCYMVLRYADAREVLRDYETYSSQIFHPLAAPWLDREQQRIAGVIVEGQALTMDPPRHTEQRKLIQRAFTNSQVHAALADIERIANDLIDGFVDRGSCDLMTDYCYRLSLRGVSTMLGFPFEQLPVFEAFITHIFTLQIPAHAPRNPNMTREKITEAYLHTEAAYGVFTEFVEDRRANPRDDLASAMLALEGDDGEPLMSNDAAVAHVVGITAAGTGTTANLVGSVARVLTAQPEILADLRAEPSLWTAAVEEGLRRYPPSSTLYRLTTRDVELGGVAIPEGSLIAVNVAAANCDPAQFPDPLAFDIHRPNLGDHIGFGLGRHFCLGSPLARPEARVALETLYSRIPELRVDLDQDVQFAANFVARAMLSQRASWPV